MKRGQVIVRGINAEGKWDSIDALDLDDESFRALMMDNLIRIGILHALCEIKVPGEPLVYRQRKAVDRKRAG